MNNKDFLNKDQQNNIKDRFRDADRLVVIDKQRKEETMQLLQKHISEKHITVLSSRRRILYNQIRYMDKSVAGIHMLFCVLLILIAALMYQRGVEKENIIFASMVLSGILGVISIVEIGHIFYPGMAELSESCYFNVKQIVAVHMSLSGIINLAVLCISILFVGVGWKINLVQIGLYVLVPFVIAECCCLGVLLTEAGRKNSYLLIMVGAFLVVFYMLLASTPNLYRVSALAVWGIAFFAGLFILSIQIKRLFKGIKRGEIICMN